MHKSGFSFLVVGNLTLASVASPVLANDIGDRINFFLSQPNTVTVYANARRTTDRMSHGAPLLFQIPAGVQRSVNMRSVQDADQARRTHEFSIFADDLPPARQYPVASIYQDSTLRKGDIVVTNTGIQVFHGSVKNNHRPSDFARWRSAQSSKRDREALSLIAKVIQPTSESHSKTVSVMPVASASVAESRKIDAAGRPMRRIELTQSQDVRESAFR